MKRLIQFFTVISVILLAFIGTSLNQAGAKSTKRSVKTTLKTYPKRFHRTWYHYVGKFNGKNYYNTTKFTKHNIKNTIYFKHNNKITKYKGNEPLKFHSVNYELSLKALDHAPKSRLNWTVAYPFNYRGKKYINVNGWYAGAGDGSFYNISKQIVNGKKVNMLSSGSGAGVWMDSKYSFSFASKTSAKTAVNKHFANFDYYA